MTTKRRALGRGLSSLIPETPPVPSSASFLPSNERGSHNLAITMSAADIVSRQMPAADEPIGLAQEVLPRERIEEISVDSITPNPHQPRQNISEEQLDELAASIRSSGILQPILVRPWGEGYQVVAGERRWRAAQKAGLERIPAIIRPVADERLLEVALVENIQRQELNPIEEARAYISLQRETGVTQAEVADRVGRQRSTVANIVRLLNLPMKVQRKVEAGSLSMGHARALLGLLDPKTQESISEIIETKGLSVRQTEEIVRRNTAPAPATLLTRPQDPNVVAAEEELSRRLSTKVRILQKSSGKGRLLIEFYSHEELDRIYEKVMKC